MMFGRELANTQQVASSNLASSLANNSERKRWRRLERWSLALSFRYSPMGNDK